MEGQNKELLEQSINVLGSVFKHTAPYSKGNLRTSMLSTPLVFGGIAIVEFGTEWESKSNIKYNYGQLLNDKRVIKNREINIKEDGKVSSERLKKRNEVRKERAYTNARTLIVKDTKYGKTMSISQRQYETNRQYNEKLNKNLKPYEKRKDYEIIRVSYDKPIKSTPPTRVNKHYHYLEDFYETYIKHLANALGGTLHNGDYGVDGKEDREYTKYFRSKVRKHEKEVGKENSKEVWQ